MSVVVKYGGSAMTDPGTRRAVASELGEMARAGEGLVVVHGGGPFIAAGLKKAGLDSQFVRGLRVTTPESLPVVEAALTTLNKKIAQQVGNAVGLTGRDAGVVQARAFDPELGLVGQVTGINKTLLTGLLNLKLTPVLACIAENQERTEAVLNVNADNVAGAVAASLGAPVIFLSNVAGVLDDPADPSSLLPELAASDIHKRIRDGRVSGGMIPKVEAALDALARGASYAVIASGEKPGTLKRVLLGKAGTRITQDG